MADKQEKKFGLVGVFKELRKNVTALIGLVLILILLFAALFTIVDQTFFDRQLIDSFLHDPLEMQFSKMMEPPSSAHPLGLDKYGRDILARLIYGSKIAVQVGVIATGIAIVLGVIVGTIAAYYGGRIDDTLMRIMEVLYSIPGLVLALTMMAALGPSVINAMIAVGVIRVPSYARVIRSRALSVSSKEYIKAAQAYGSGDFRIIFRHVLPNSVAPVIIQASLGIGSAIITVASLSFLGFGVQPPTPSWGRLLSSGRDVLLVAPHIATFPGIAILFAVMGFNLFGDGLRDILDPKLRGESMV
ncbi:ABC transporter permease [Candidatus Bipolaricaulota bacterium]|nr:ABC transporter permease [Candidatus Bipolaricaulota bacterium]